MPKVYLPQYDVTINAPDDQPIERIQAEIEAKRPEIEAYAAQRMGVSPEQFQQGQAAAFEGQKIPVVPNPEGVRLPFGIDEPFRGFASGSVALGSAALQGAGELLRHKQQRFLDETNIGEMIPALNQPAQNPLQGAAKAQSDLAQKVMQGGREGFLPEAARGIGATVPLMVGGAATTAVTGNPALGVGVMAGGAGAMGANEAYQQTGNLAYALRQGAIETAVTGLMSAIPGGGGLEKAVTQGIKGGLKELSKDIGAEMMEEATIYLAQGINNYVSGEELVGKTPDDVARDLAMIGTQVAALVGSAAAARKLAERGAQQTDAPPSNEVPIPETPQGPPPGGPQPSSGGTPKGRVDGDTWTAPDGSTFTVQGGITPEMAAYFDSVYAQRVEAERAAREQADARINEARAATQPQQRTVVESEIVEPEVVEATARVVPKRLSRFEQTFEQAAAESNVDPVTLMAVAMAESSGNPNVTSKAGAKGLMQLMDGTAAEYGVTNPFDPNQSIYGAARYMRWLLDRYNGDLDKALAGYNAGPGNVDKYGGIPPFKETQAYVRKVKAKMAEIGGDTETATVLSTPEPKLQELADARREKGEPLTAAEVKEVVGGKKEKVKPLRDWVNREKEADLARQAEEAALPTPPAPAQGPAVKPFVAEDAEDADSESVRAEPIRSRITIGTTEYGKIDPFEFSVTGRGGETFTGRFSHGGGNPIRIQILGPDGAVLEEANPWHTIPDPKSPEEAQAGIIATMKGLLRKHGWEEPDRFVGSGATPESRQLPVQQSQPAGGLPDAVQTEGQGTITVYRGRQKGDIKDAGSWWSESEEFADTFSKRVKGKKNLVDTGEVVSQEIPASKVKSTSLNAGDPFVFDGTEYQLGLGIPDIRAALRSTGVKADESLAESVVPGGWIRTHVLLENPGIQKALAAKGYEYVQAYEDVRPGEPVKTFLKLQGQGRAQEVAPTPIEVPEQQIRSRIAFLTKAPMKGGQGKPRISFKTQREQNAFERGFGYGFRNPNGSPRERQPGLSAKEAKYQDAVDQGFSQGALAAREHKRITEAILSQQDVEVRDLDSFGIPLPEGYVTPANSATAVYLGSKVAPVQPTQNQDLPQGATARGPIASIFGRGFSIDASRRNAKPQRDPRGEPTGWLRIDAEDGPILIHPNRDEVIPFYVKNTKSGTEMARRQAEAQIYASENPVQRDTPTEPSGPLVTKPLFSQQPASITFTRPEVGVQRATLGDQSLDIVKMKDGYEVRTPDGEVANVFEKMADAKAWVKQEMEGNAAALEALVEIFGIPSQPQVAPVQPKQPWEMTRDGFEKSIDSTPGNFARKMKEERKNAARNLPYQFTETQTGVITESPSVTRTRDWQKLTGIRNISVSQDGVLYPTMTQSGPVWTEGDVLKLQEIAEGLGGRLEVVTGKQDGEEWVKRKGQAFKFVPKSAHELYVEQAVREGKPVPAEVLAEYPDVAAQFQQSPAPSTSKLPVWQTPQAEYVAQRLGDTKGMTPEDIEQRTADIVKTHRNAVKRAQGQKREVPQEVLAAYPDMAGEAKVSEAASVPTTQAQPSPQAAPAPPTSPLDAAWQRHRDLMASPDATMNETLRAVEDVRKAYESVYGDGTATGKPFINFLKTGKPPKNAVPQSDAKRAGVAETLTVKSPKEMTAKAINDELDAIDARQVELMDLLIESGRGNEKLQEILTKSDPISVEYKASVQRRNDLKSEVNARYGWESGQSRLDPKNKKHAKRGADQTNPQAGVALNPFSLLTPKPDKPKPRQKSDNPVLDRMYAMQDKGERTRRKIYNEQQRKGRLTLQSLWESALVAIVDSRYALPKKLRKVVGDRRYVPTRVNQMLHESEKNVAQFISQNGMNVEDFGAFLAFRRMAGERSGIQNPFTPEEVAEGIAGLRAKVGQEGMAKLEEAAQMMHEGRKPLLDEMFASGLISEGQLESFKNRDEYATFNVQDFLEPTMGRAPGGKIFEQKGTGRDIENPFVATTVKDVQLTYAAALNKSVRDTVRHLQEVDPDRVRPAKPFEQPKDRDYKLVMYRDGGEVKAAHIPASMAKALDIDPVTTSLGLRILNVMNAPFRSVWVVNNPGFGSMNLLRDMTSAFWKLPSRQANALQRSMMGRSADIAMQPARILQSYGRTARDVWADVFYNDRRPFMAEMYRNGLVIEGRAFRNMEGTVATELERQAARFDLAPEKEEAFAKKWGKRIFIQWNEFTEKWGKAAGTDYLLRQGYRLDDPDVVEMIRNRAGSPDFLARGSYGQGLNQVFMFSNPAIQGWRGLAEAFKDDPLEFGMKASLLAVPKLLQLAVEAGLLGEWAEEILAAAPDYDKMNYLTIPFGMTDQNESVYVRFPMAHESQMLQKMTYLSMKGAMGDFRGEEIARALKSQDPYALSNLAPAIQILNDISQVAIGINPQDSWYGAGKVPQAEFDAGGADRWLAFGKALYNDNIGNSIWKIKSGTESEIRSDMSRYLEVPGVAQMVGRFLKVSGKGREDELRRIAVEQEREDAKVGLGIRRYIGPVVSEMPSTATEAQMKSTARKAYNEAKRTGVVPKDYEFQHFWARFRTLAALKYGTPEERIGRSSSRNVQEAIGYERPQSGTNNGFAPSFQSGFSGGGFQPGF